MEERDRITSVDLFRGITIAGMVLVNNQGDWASVYPALRHAVWHGWSGADLVFPFFLFIMGVSLTLSLSAKRESGEGRGRLILKILKRTLLLLLLGLFLNFFPDFQRDTARLPGVLQRIALCYFFSSVLFLFYGKKTQALLAAGLLLLYWVILEYSPGEGFWRGTFDPAGNICRHIDSRIFGAHTYADAPVKGFDPEGLLSTVPAISSTLAGALAGYGLLPGANRRHTLAGFFIAGVACTALGLLWSVILPINKNLWTPSYAVFMTGIALLLLSPCFALADIRGWKAWAKPFLVLGTNAVAVYFLSSLAAKASVVIMVTQADGRETTLKTFLFNILITPWAGGYAASLLYAAAYLLLWTGLMVPLYRKKIFIRI